VRLARSNAVRGFGAGLPVVVSTKGGACCLSLVGPRTCWRVGGTRENLVEALLPQGRERFELAFPSGGSGSCGLMPLAARHTAISPMRAVLW
jgi:hypothetical protein